MYIKKFQIENFKAFQNITIHFNKDVNNLTGVNNSGKTSVLDALSFWNECFYKLINQAKRTVKDRYDMGDFVLEPSSNKYFGFEEINSVRSPNFENIFRNRDKKNKIILIASIENDFVDSITLSFKIGDSAVNS